MFWNKVEDYIKLLKPEATVITMVERNQNLSVVMKILHDLQKSFEEQLPCSPVLKTVELAIKAVLAKRKDFIVQKVHLAADLLDPGYRGCHISDEEIVN